jgi:ATP-binding cassette subfamily F protein uup
MPSSDNKKLSYAEAREFAAMEIRIAEAEAQLRASHAALEDPAVTSDRLRLQAACNEVDQAQKAVDDLYTRWAALEEKQN